MAFRALALLILCGVVLYALPVLAESRQTAGIRMLCLNVGKGDAILLSLEGRHYLVDTGYKRTFKQLQAALAFEGIDRLDAVFITHPHKDHVGGLEKLLLSGIQVDAVYSPALTQAGNGAGHPAVSAAARAGKKVTFLRAGELIPVSSVAYFDILGPRSLNTDNENNNSLVMTLVSPDGVVLLTGDMKAEEELSLLRADVLTACDVLKVPFHGDGSASTTSFLKAVRPRVSVISTSTREEKDTPDRDVLVRLASVGSEIYVTQDAQDAVLVTLIDKKPRAEYLSFD